MIMAGEMGIFYLMCMLVFWVNSNLRTFNPISKFKSLVGVEKTVTYYADFMTNFVYTMIFGGANFMLKMSKEIGTK